jgi:thiol-disulfide isomerase/thioredoxin
MRGMAEQPVGQVALPATKLGTARLVVAWLAAVVLAVGVSIASHKIGRPPPPAKFEPFPLLLFEVKDLTRSSIDLRSFDGTVSLVNIWATWCGPCRAEIPDLITLQRRYGTSIRVIGLSVDEGDESIVRDFIGKFAVNYSIVHWTPQTQTSFERPEALPITYLVTPDRTVSHRFLGRIDLDSVARVIDRVLQKEELANGIPSDDRRSR